MAEKRKVSPGPPSGVAPTSWDPVARWYTRLVGQEGSSYHRELAIPALLELLDPCPGESILDIGAGPGALASHIARAKAVYTGVDASARLLQFARRHHGGKGTFILGDALRLPEVPGLKEGTFDAVVFLLSIQDIDPLGPALASAAWALKPEGRIVLLMTHPCFHVPRQSGWGWDEGRKLQFRRIDHYLTPLPVPMKPYPGGSGATRSFHRPLHAYVNGLADCGFLIDRLTEVPAHKVIRPGPRARALERAYREIPLFLGLRARRQRRS